MPVTRVYLRPAGKATEANQTRHGGMLPMQFPDDTAGRRIAERAD